MTYYLVTDGGTQWFHYLISKHEGKVVDVHDMSPIKGDSTLLSNIYAREPIQHFPDVRDGRMTGSLFGGWSISKLEFDRIKRMLELVPSIREYAQLANSV